MIPKQAPEINCLGKEQLSSFSLASMVASRIASRHDAHIRPYKCEHCGFYHIGELINKPKGKGRKWKTSKEKNRRSPLI